MTKCSIIPLLNFVQNTVNGISNTKKYISLWKSGKVNGITEKADISSHVRRYLFEKYHSKCQICRWSQINPVTGKTPL